MNNEEVEGNESRQQAPGSVRGSSPSKLQTGLLMISSALLGGIAFAVWNRRQIGSIHSQPVPESQGTNSAEDDAIY
jgi:hypothetical protein